MIVVDLGCHGHGMYDSIGELQRKYRPDVLYGFDPLAEDGIRRIGKTVVLTRKLAAWLTNGSAPFIEAGTASRVGKSIHNVPCFDLAPWLETQPGEVVVKMDVEGAELALCRRLRRRRVDERISLLLVETHGDIVLPELRCPVEEWWM